MYFSYVLQKTAICLNMHTKNIFPPTAFFSKGEFLLNKKLVCLIFFRKSTIVLVYIECYGTVRVIIITPLSGRNQLYNYFILKIGHSRKSMYWSHNERDLVRFLAFLVCCNIQLQWNNLANKGNVPLKLDVANLLRWIF